MNRQTFQQAAQLSDVLADRWFPHVSAAAAEFEITTSKRLAAWIAQIGHESGGFTQLVESFNYRVDALKIFSRIPADMREQLGRRSNERIVPIERQMTIANLAYGGRYGNGDASSGDGWRYRGRGLKQITFKDNYRMCGVALSVDLVAQPELLEQDEYAARSAGWFWRANGLNKLADDGDFVRITRVINGGLTGHPERQARWQAATDVFLA
ncbi:MULTISPECIES: glycoside hydrolase family 19 protein [Burkholderia]|uniref:glycoside hydrolase family 19 protein n=1 Tax=Burkholderia TaxID=32008 RepID=UPI00075A9DEB|nr:MULTISPECIES: glycoside hydrolase family 19 protein [Burkholderia]AOJ73514.1 endolysin [Burkholderia savannae]KVG38945.1 endolysin [Burkholderia sp. MSMB0265]KVG81670.1 endolysin [Burkholderia sp. MSMB2040]KVG98829.1 endolysin [Burkholderia sp. MSMB2042]KVG99008.1 endolysin [Burkholderia sp. MSMB2041]